MKERSSRFLELVSTLLYFDNLPKEEQIAVASAFVSEMIMGENPEGELSPLQTMLYSVIRFYVQQDSAKFNGAYAHSNVAV